MLCQPKGTLTGQIYYQQGWGKACELVKGPAVQNAICSIPHLLVEGPGDEVVYHSSTCVHLDVNQREEFVESSAVCFEVNLPDVDFTSATWRPVGPADYRRYRILEGEGSDSLTSLIQYLIGEEFKQKLAEFTQLSLGECASFEARQCGPGDYQMLNDGYPEPTGLDVILMHSTSADTIEAWHYLVEGETQFTMPIREGWWMGLVYRTDEVRRFQRRQSLQCPTISHQILLTFAVI